MELISTGLDRKSRQNPCGTARSALRPAPAQSSPALFIQRRERTECAFTWSVRSTNLPASTSASALATKKTSAAEEKQGVGRRSAKGQRAETQPEGCSRGKNTYCCGCACWAGTCVAVGWVSLIEELAAQPRQRGQFIR